jgi:hypothetical protein
MLVRTNSGKFVNSAQVSVWEQRGGSVEACLSFGNRVGIFSGGEEEAQAVLEGIIMGMARGVSIYDGSKVPKEEPAIEDTGSCLTP